METEVLKIETGEHFAAAIEKCAEVLRRGGVAAVPTETVYGLAANALDEAAVRRIFAAKGRPARNPLIVHVASLEMARACVSGWPAAAGALAAACWPGPLTIVLPKARSIPPVVTGGGATVGIRWPMHPFMQELIARCGFPLAAPSANLSNELSPTNAEHVLRMLRGRIPLIVDAGPCSVGIESTVADLTTEPPEILRPGMITAAQIGRALGTDTGEDRRPGGPLKSPGLLRRHYAPRTRLAVVSWRTEEELEAAVRRLGVPFEKVTVIAHERIPRRHVFGRVAVIPQDPEAYARALYAELHRCDELGAGLIVAESVPPGAPWAGIRDRLKRASAET